MSNLKTRLAKLEEAQKSKAVYQETPESEEKTRQWLDNTIRDINERQRLIDEGLIIEGPQEPIKPLRPDASPTQIWMHDQMIATEAMERAGSGRV
jgi:hypothetical protein